MKRLLSYIIYRTIAFQSRYTCSLNLTDGLMPELSHRLPFWNFAEMIIHKWMDQQNCVCTFKEFKFYPFRTVHFILYHITQRAFSTSIRRRNFKFDVDSTLALKKSRKSVDKLTSKYRRRFDVENSTSYVRAIAMPLAIVLTSYRLEVKQVARQIVRPPFVSHTKEIISIMLT